MQPSGAGLLPLLLGILRSRRLPPITTAAPSAPDSLKNVAALRGHERFSHQTHQLISNLDAD
eukprot:12934797-Prorocentrum_lima.AAC.1